MDDADPRLSKFLLTGTALGAGLNLVSSVRTRGLRRSAAFLALSIGLPAVGELLAVGPLGLLRHRTRPRMAGVPAGILLGWYCGIHGSYSVTENALARFPLSEASRKRLLPIVAALVGTSLDLVLDPAGLDAGLWEWNGDGSYAREVAGSNGRCGVPLINYAGWLLLVAGVGAIYGRLFEDQGRAGRAPALLLVPPYLAAAAWASNGGRSRYLFLSAPFPITLLASLTGSDRQEPTRGQAARVL